MPFSVLGTPGGIYKPEVKINGEPISTMSAEFPVGQMARASCGMKPESLSALRQGGQIKANDTVLFTGSGWAPRGKASSRSLDFGFSLIHPAHKLDAGRAWAPGLHPMSTEHYTFTMGAGGSTTLDDSIFGDKRVMKFDLTKSLAEEIPSFIIRAMERASQKSKENLDDAGVDGNIAEGNADVVAAMREIKGLTECRIDFEGLGSTDISNSASNFAKQVVMNSITANKSAWDLLAMMASSFGMQVICWPDGTTKMCPDFSGCKPPKGNRITGDIIDSWEGSAEYTRSARGVLVISYGFTRGFSAANPSNANAYDPIAANQASYIGTGTGGLFITGLPGWMMAYQLGGIPTINKKLAELYAKQIYAEVNNMGRTFAISTPLCPDARPGTTYYFEPISNAKNITDGGEVETPFSAEYAGYCYKISHVASAEGQFHTHWHFRNIFTPEEYDLMLDSAPFFNDTPFEIGPGGNKGDGGGEDDGGQLPQAEGVNLSNTGGANFDASL